MVKIGKPDGAAGSENIVEQKHDVIIMRHDGKGEGVGVGTGEGKRVVVKEIDGTGGNAEVEKILTSGKDGEYTTPDGKKVIVRSMGDGKNAEFTVTDNKRAMTRTDDGKQIERVIINEKAGAHHAERDNELFRTTLSLLLSSPEGMDVTYTFGGE